MTIAKRKRSNNTSAVGDENENPNEELNSKVENLQKNVTEILGELQKLNETKRNEESEAKKKPSFNSVISPGSLMKKTSSSGMPSVGRSFVLKHVFENVSKMEEGKDYDSEVEEHFGVPWTMYIVKKEKHIGFYLNCIKSVNIGKWEIEAKRTLKFIRGCAKKGNDEDVFGNCNNVYKITAWGEMKCFNESAKDVSDTVLVVGEQKFFVLKLYLAAHSPFFKALFLGQFQESNESEIKLTGIEAEDFQNYLEVLYGDPAIDETTVEGILLVADMYDTSIVIGKCEDFLLKKSKKSDKKMLQMAIRYNLDKLKAKCMLKIKTKADIKSVISRNAEDLDRSILAQLLEKSLSLQ